MTLRNLVDDSMTLPRFAMLLIASFAGLVLLLASIGMYGVICASRLARNAATFSQ
jgi:hypothetical protein